MKLVQAQVPLDDVQEDSSLVEEYQDNHESSGLLTLVQFIAGAGAMFLGFVSVCVFFSLISSNIKKAQISKKAQIKELDRQAQIKELEKLNKEISLDPKNAEKYLRRGLLRLKNEDPQAIEDINEAININPDLATAYIVRADYQLYRQGTDHKVVIEDFTQALRIEPDNLKIRLRRAKAYSAISKYDEAIEDFTQALRIEPDNLEIRLRRADTYSAISKYDEAIEDLAKAREVINSIANDKDIKRYYDTLFSYACIFYNRALSENNLEYFDKALNVYYECRVYYEGTARDLDAYPNYENSLNPDVFRGVFRDYTRENIKIIRFLIRELNKNTSNDQSEPHASPAQPSIQSIDTNNGQEILTTDGYAAITYANKLGTELSSSNDSSFSRERMKHINSSGYKIYQKAEEEQNAELFYKAGEAYDRSYDAFWGDHVFGGTDYQSFLDNLGLSEDVIDKEGVKELIKAQQESLAFSCECYAKCLLLDPDHYEANLRLATALTVALQVEVSLPYWRKALATNRSGTLQALIADSTGFHHRSIAAKEVIKYLKLQQADYPEWAESLAAFGEVINRLEVKGTVPETLSFIQQKAIASNLLKSSAFLIREIQNLGNGEVAGEDCSTSEQKKVVIVVNGQLFYIVPPLVLPVDLKSATVKATATVMTLQEIYGAEVQILHLSAAQARELKSILGSPLGPEFKRVASKFQEAVDEYKDSQLRGVSGTSDIRRLQIAGQRLEPILNKLGIPTSVFTNWGTYQKRG